MSANKNKDIKPLIAKLVVAIALSFAGSFYSRFMNKRIKPALSPKPSDHATEAKRTGDLSSFVLEKISTSKAEVENGAVLVSPESSGSGGNGDDFLSPEFNNLIKEFELAKKDVEISRPNLSARDRDNVDNEQEIKLLRNRISRLQKRVGNLEDQLLEYYGLKEQEIVVSELMNRLNINNTEAKRLTLKIESLQAENRRLEVQVADHAKIAAELEHARSQTMILKTKIIVEAQQNKGQIINLKERVSRMQEQDLKDSAMDPDVLVKLQKLNNLEAEKEELRKSNLTLQSANSELACKLESTEILKESILQDPEGETLREESNRLKHENEELQKENDQLQAYRCADVEELVYLRWVNACLRYELRYCQPLPGKTMARDLSEKLSPASEEKAKQLILEYANSEGLRDKEINVSDFDLWSMSQNSYFTDSEELGSSLDDSSITKTNSSSKRKLLNKLKRLVRGKDTNSHSRASSTDIFLSLEDLNCNSRAGAGADDALQMKRKVTLAQLFAEHSKDSNNGRRNSDVGSYGGNCNSNRLVLYRQGSTGYTQEGRVDIESNFSSGSELMNFAEVLRQSSLEKNMYKKSASYSFGET